MAGDHRSLQSLEEAVAYAGNAEAVVALFGDLARIACSKYPELAGNAHIQSLIPVRSPKVSGNVVAGSSTEADNRSEADSGRPGSSIIPAICRVSIP